jgi:predicted amidophosphoribosyltransferase
MPDPLTAVLDLVWPRSCGGCGRPGVSWCADCAQLLAGPALRTRPVPCPPALPPVWTAAAYDGPVRQAIVAWKDDGRHDLTSALSVALATAVRAAVGSGPRIGSVWVVPMPSRGAARRNRGTDSVRLLAARAVAVLRRDGWPLLVVPALRHRRAVADQSGLDAAGRAANLAGALSVRPALRRAAGGAACVLVDDIVTTGATLAEAASALRRAGAHPFGAAVVAATQRTARRTDRGQVTKVAERD